MSDEVVYKVGDTVYAKVRVTEGSIYADNTGNKEAKFQDDNYIHAELGEVGEVLHVDDDGQPTVRFERTGTATLVAQDEITDSEPVHVRNEIFALLEERGCHVYWNKDADIVTVTTPDKVTWDFTTPRYYVKPEDLANEELRASRSWTDRYYIQD